MGIGTSSRSRGAPKRPHANGLRANHAASELGRPSPREQAPRQVRRSRRPADACHLIETPRRWCGPAGMAVSRVVALKGPVGWLPSRLPAAMAWLSNDVSACWGLAVAWLKEARTPAGPGIRHARHGHTCKDTGRAIMAVVMIGVDPHKGSHTAVAIDAAEEPLGELRVRASAVQAERLLAWAQAWPERAWAIEGAGGLGHLLGQQLLAAGERVLDVAPKLGARVRLLASGAVNKNDPSDARPVAIAALRSASCRQVMADDHAAVLKVWSKRHHDLGRTRNQVACRLHAVLCELVPGGVAKEITAAHAADLLEATAPCDAVEAARWELAAEFTEDLRRIDARMHDTKRSWPWRCGLPALA